jgi:hypothetical protein
MANFQFKALVRDVDDAQRVQVANPKTLEIVVSDARQIFPQSAGNLEGANRLLIFAGTIRFGRDPDTGTDEIEDPMNEINEETEVDEGEQRTVQLKLRDPNAPLDRLTGSTSIASLGNIYLAGHHGGIDVLTDLFGVNVANALAQNVKDDIWLFSDVVAELGSQMNRLAYQVNALVHVKSPPGK